MSTKEMSTYDSAQLGENDDLLGIVQEIKIWQYIAMVYAQTRTRIGEWDALYTLGLWDTHESTRRHDILLQKTKLAV